MATHMIGAIGRTKDGKEVRMFFPSLASLVYCAIPTDEVGGDGENGVIEIRLDELLGQYADEINENTSTLTQLQGAKVYTLSELYAHIGNDAVHSNAAQIMNTLSAVGELIQHAESGEIHVLQGDKPRWDAGAVAANNALASAGEANGKINQHESRIVRLEDGLFSNITGNPFLVGFDNLTGINITKGNWNSTQQRVEC